MPSKLFCIVLHCIVIIIIITYSYHTLYYCVSVLIIILQYFICGCYTSFYLLIYLRLPVQVNALAMVYRQCGQELCAADPAAFDSLVCNLRDAFIKGTDVQSNSILLMLIELYAS